MKNSDRLIITIPASEAWDEKNECFIYNKEQTITLKHSLISVSEWEAKWHKPFLAKEDKTNEELRDYVRCMTITQNVDPDCYLYLTPGNLKEIMEYIDDPMSATKIYEEKKPGSASREIITSELVYFWMCNFRIPPEYAKWHLNRLLTLIRICIIKNTPPKKRGARDIMSRNAALNAERRARLNSKG